MVDELNTNRGNLIVIAAAIFQMLSWHFRNLHLVSRAKQKEFLTSPPQLPDAQSLMYGA